MNAPPPEVPPSPPRRVVNIMQATRIVGVSRRTMLNWIRAHKVEWRRTAGGQVRIFEDSLRRVQAAHIPDPPIKDR